MKPGAVIALARANPWPAIASFSGAALMFGSFAVRGQLSALMLEVGAGLALVVIVFALEQRMSAQLETRQDEKLSNLERELVARFEGPPQAAAAEVVRRSGDDVAAARAAFETDPTPATLAELVDYVTSIKQPAATQVEVAPGWLLNVGVSRSPYVAGEAPRPIVQLKVVDQSANGPSEPVDWRDDLSYADMLGRLRVTWINFSKEWPGDDAFTRINFPRVIADGFVDLIDAASRGSGKIG
jgi:hypothetical protein